MRPTGYTPGMPTHLESSYHGYFPDDVYTLIHGWEIEKGHPKQIPLGAMCEGVNLPRPFTGVWTSFDATLSYVETRFRLRLENVTKGNQ